VAVTPEWKTKVIDFLNDVADSIENWKHVTERQLEVIENAEEKNG
jgi:hypothetical protein